MFGDFPECLEISPVLLERFKHPPNVLGGGMSFLLHLALSLSLSLSPSSISTRTRMIKKVGIWLHEVDPIDIQRQILEWTIC